MRAPKKPSRKPGTVFFRAASSETADPAPAPFLMPYRGAGPYGTEASAAESAWENHGTGGEERVQEEQTWGEEQAWDGPHVTGHGWRDWDGRTCGVSASGGDGDDDAAWPGAVSGREDWTSSGAAYGGNGLPKAPAGEKYVAYMGGEAAVLRRARADFERGEYPWVAEVLRHVVYANPANRQARELLARTYDRLGRQAASDAWRTIYFHSAIELRDGLADGAGSAETAPRSGPEPISVRPAGALTEGRRVALNVDFLDAGPRYALVIEDATLFCFEQPVDDADATLALSRRTLDRIRHGETSVAEALATGALVIEGRQDALGEFLHLLEGAPGRAA